ncbi:MAG: hypothetical protein KC777_09005 [Cyanobacteria bacterium HKST-UBA02]|nr:hypothetical protein [Cyanobacteria bacterium HKST-UBA02]
MSSCLSIKSFRLILLGVALYLAGTVARMAFITELPMIVAAGLGLVAFSLILLVFEKRWSEKSNLAISLNVLALALIAVKLTGF